jgi:hypothetical protein
METDPNTKSDDRDQGIEDVLSAFNAEQILSDPDDQDPKRYEKLEPAATPDSPNPI